MATFFADPSIGGSSGAGTIGDPYSGVQHCLNSETQNSGGDKVCVKAGTAEILTAALDLSTYGTPSSGSPLIFEGYTSSEGDGGIGQIEGETNNVSIFNSSTLDYIHFRYMECITDATGYCIGLDNAIVIENCFIQNKGTGGVVDFDVGVMRNCELVAATGNGFNGNTQTKLSHCYIRNTGTSGGRTISGAIEFCIFAIDLSADSNTEVMGPPADGAIFQHNTIKATATPGSGCFAISSLNREGLRVSNNYIEGFAGTSGGGVEFSSTGEGCYGDNNYYYNNTTNEQQDSNSSEFVGATNLGSSGIDANFNPNSSLIDNATPQGFRGLGSNNHYMTPGAVQLTQTQSGGGGGIAKLIGNGGGLIS